MNEIINSGFRCLILFTMFIVMAIASIFLIAAAPLFSAIIKTMPQLSAGQVNLMTMATFNIFAALGAVLGGPLLDKFGIIKVYIVCLIIILTGTLLTPFAGSTAWGISFIRSLQGIGAGPIMVSGVPIAARYFPPGQRSLIIVIAGLPVLLGVLIGSFSITNIYQATQNWQTALAWLAPICILGLIISVIAAVVSKQPAEDRTKTPFMEALKAAFSKPVTWVVLACLALYSWFFQVFNDLLPIYINAPAPGGLGYDTGSSGILLTVASWIVICGAFTGVLIAEKFLKGNARPVVLAGFVLGAVFISFINVPAMASNHMFLWICVCGCAFFSAFISPLLLGYIAKYYPEHITGTLGGLAGGIGILAGFVGPMVSGTAMQMSGGYQMSLSIMIGIAVIGAIAALFLMPVKES